MGKINCDVCGTAYPESASQCPICGCVRSAEGAVCAETEDLQNRSESYTYVKGGRFSKANVRKRNQGAPVQDMPQFQDSDPEEFLDVNGKTDKGLVAAVCVLLLAIVAVVIYIVSRFFAPDVPDNLGGGNLHIQPSTEATTGSTLIPQTTEPVEIPTTEEVVESTVEETVAVTVPESQPTENQNYYIKPFELSTAKRKNDVTIYRNGTFELELRDASGELMDVDWVVVDPEICSVENNTVTGLKAGKTTVQVTIDDATYACIVRVKA